MPQVVAIPAAQNVAIPVDQTERETAQAVDEPPIPSKEQLA